MDKVGNVTTFLFSNLTGYDIVTLIYLMRRIMKCLPG